MDFLTALLAALSIGITQPKSVTIPEPYMREFAVQAIRTWMSGIEVLYCAQGYHERGHFRVTGIIKPEQSTIQQRIYTTVQEADSTYSIVEYMSGVNNVPCPKGTIFAIHTHPFGSVEPSDMDIRSFKKDNHPMNAIITVNGRGEVELEVLDRSLEEVPVRTTTKRRR